jgi:hypothetical protein
LKSFLNHGTVRFVGQVREILNRLSSSPQKEFGPGDQLTESRI